MSDTVVVLGASPKINRYSNKAVRLLKDKGYNVIPVHPAAKSIYDIEVVPNLNLIDVSVHTVTVYINSSLFNKYLQDVINLLPKRVILNPGTESASDIDILESNGIQVLTACTLVMLKTGQF